MRDVLRLGDVDFIQDCNANSTIAQADNLLMRVVRHGGSLIRQTSCPVEWQPSEAAFEACLQSEVCS